MDDLRTYTFPLPLLLRLFGAFIPIMIHIDPPLWTWLVGGLWLVLALAALLAQTSAGGRKYLAETLRHTRYTQVYLIIARRLNDHIWRRVCTMRVTPEGARRFLRQMRRCRAYCVVL